MKRLPDFASTTKLEMIQYEEILGWKFISWGSSLLWRRAEQGLRYKTIRLEAASGLQTDRAGALISVRVLQDFKSGASAGVYGFFARRFSNLNAGFHYKTCQS